ncbi:1,2-dihydroxy-3-keto-5-methylthiopentene dioxygenase [Xanthoria parietina]
MENEGRTLPLQRPSNTAAMTGAGKLQLPASCDPPGPQNPPEQLVWVIFGATGHVGRSIAKAALSHHDLVTTVGQSREDILTSTQSSFRAYPDHYLPLSCDIRIRSTVEDVIQQSIAHWGRIDIIANCTGYGVIGACEDQDDYDIRNQFETNFFGTINILGASLPYFRTRQPSQRQTSTSVKHEPSSESSTRSPEDEPRHSSALGGRYLIFSSTCGALGVPGLGPYSATKHAVEGLIESMLYETHAFNIKATLVEPGHLRPDDDDDDEHKIAASTPPADSPEEESRRKSRNRTDPSRLASTHFQYKPPHPKSPYKTPTSPATHPLRVLAWLSRTPTPSPSTSSSTKPPNQPLTSTARCAEVVWQLGHCAYPPLRLLLGAFAVESMRDRLRCVIEEIEEWRWLGFDGDGEDVEEESREAVIKGGGEDGDGEEEGAEDMGEEGPGDGEGNGMEDDEAAGEGGDKDEGRVGPVSSGNNK